MKIPHPPRLPLIGNMHQLIGGKPNVKMKNLIDKYGEIVAVKLPLGELILIGSQKLTNEVCDEKRFKKKSPPALIVLRDLVRNGLFTAETEDPEWGYAHRILTPAFAGADIKNMFPTMVEVAEEMIKNWERLPKEEVIDLQDQMTRATLETIGKTAFNFSFQSFKKEEKHPFIQKMSNVLKETRRKVYRPSFLTPIYKKSEKRYWEDINYMRGLAEQIVRDRKKKENSDQYDDLLSIMQQNPDPKTGILLSEDQIINQIITFLIAGHETTSGLISLSIFYLLKNPECLKRTKDCIIGNLVNGKITIEGIRKMDYVQAVLKETLRLTPTVPAFGLTPIEDTIIGDKYKVKVGDNLFVLLPSVHRDKKVWEEPDKFNPERFLRVNYKDLPPNSWKPFGNGKRICIGKGFAIQEAAIMLSIVLRKFDLKLFPSDYELILENNLSFRPVNLMIQISKSR